MIFFGTADFTLFCHTSFLLFTGIKTLSSLPLSYMVLLAPTLPFRRTTTFGVFSVLLFRASPAFGFFMNPPKATRMTPVCSASSSATAAPAAPPPKKKLQPKYRASYRQPDFWIPQVDLDIRLLPEDKLQECSGEENKKETVSLVSSTLKVVRNHEYKGADSPDLELDGEVGGKG